MSLLVVAPSVVFASGSFVGSVPHSGLSRFYREKT